MAKRKSKYRSGFEERVAADLEGRGIKFEYEPFSIEYQKPVRKAECAACGGADVVRTHVYTPDFVLRKSGVIIECKGWFKATDRTKMLAIKKSRPELDIKMLFAEDKWTTKNKLTKYSGWCDKNGIDWAIGGVPDEWC